MIRDVRMVIVAAAAATACGQASPTSGVPFELSLSPITVEEFRCIDACPTTGPCSDPPPCLPLFAILATLTITETGGSRLVISDVRAEVVRPDGIGVGTMRPRIPGPIPAGATADTHVAVGTRPGVLEPGTVLAATVWAAGHEVTVQAPVPLP